MKHGFKKNFLLLAKIYNMYKSYLFIFDKSDKPLNDIFLFSSVILISNKLQSLHFL